MVHNQIHDYDAYYHHICILSGPLWGTFSHPGKLRLVQISAKLVHISAKLVQFNTKLVQMLMEPAP